MRTILICTGVVVLLAACSHQVQMTSGKEYLARTSAAPAPSELIKKTYTARNGKAVTETREILSTDELVRRAASVEPLLTLPARIGLARIEHGQLTVIPQHEAEFWRVLTASFPGLGEVVPLDPFLAEYARETVLPQDARMRRGDANSIITKIRLGAARQHVDAVLVYEVGAGSRSTGIDGLSMISVLGNAGPGSALPGKRRVGRAILMDVRNGYPYATISAKANLEGAKPDFWVNDADEKAYIEATRRIVHALTGEVRQVFTRIVAASKTRVVRN